MIPLERKPHPTPSYPQPILRYVNNISVEPPSPSFLTNELKDLKLINNFNGLQMDKNAQIQKIWDRAALW